MARSSKREALLDAAGQLVRREGTDRLTLDAVAAEAGVSKGGLLYHFASKEELVEGLVRRLIDGFEASLEKHLDEGAPGAFCRAYVRATAEPPPGEGSTTAALLAAVAQAPALLDPLRERYLAWDRALASDGIDPTDAQVVRLAADGLWMADLLGLAPLRGKARERVVARLVALASGVEGAPAGRKGGKP